MRDAQPLDEVRKLAETVLYGGMRGRQRRWSFGHLYPRGYGVWSAGPAQYAQQLQCLVEGPAHARIQVCLRFLQAVETRHAPGKWLTGVEREACGPVASLADLVEAPQRREFEFPALCGLISARAQRLGDDCHRLTIRAENLTPFDPAAPWSQDEAGMYAFVAPHMVVRAEGGRLVSLIDPPATRAEEAARCVNRGCFPVLLGDPSVRDTMLASPTILGDFPESGDTTVPRGPMRHSRDKESHSARHDGLGRG